MSVQKINVLITGATGFTGSFIVKEFQVFSEIYSVHILARSKEKVVSLGLDKYPIIVHYGCFEDGESFQNACKQIDIFVNAASLGFGHAPAIINILKKTGIKRAIFISTTGIFTNLNSSSKRIRLEAESLIENSKFDYTIVRPTMIFGTQQDRNICRLIRYIKKWPIIPVAGPGTYLMQPVYVSDLAKAIVTIAGQQSTINKTYTISGKDVVSYNQLICLIAGILNKNIFIIHFPLQVLTIIFSMYEKLVKNPKIKVEQLLRLNENKIFSYCEAESDFGYKPTPIKQVIFQEIQEMAGCQS